MIVLVSQDGFVNRTPMDIKRTPRGSEGKTVGPRWFKILREPEGSNDLVLLTNLGGIVRISLQQIRPMGGESRGVRAIKLQPYESIQDAIIMGSDEQ